MEQRLKERLVNYWNLLKKEMDMPDFAHFNSSAIEDIWQQCILFQVMPAPEGKMPNVTFKMVGEEARAVYGQDMTGRSFAPPLKQFQGAAIIRKMPEVLANPVPLTDEGQFVTANSKMVRFRSCMLPFGTNGKITHIVTGLSWREM